MLPAEVHALLDPLLATSLLRATVYDGHGRIVYASPQTLEILKLSRDEAIGKTPSELGLLSQDISEIDGLLHQALESGGAERQIVASITGEVEVALTPVKNDLGVVEFVVCTERGIPGNPIGEAQSTTQQAAREGEERWRFAVEGSGDGVWDWDIQTNHMFYSSAYWEILGFKPDEADASVEDFDARVHPEDKSGVLENTIQLFRGDVPAFIREYRLRCKDGSYKWVLSRGKVVKRSADGQPMRVIGTISDITARKTAEAELQLAVQVYENSSEAILVTDHENHILSVNPTFSRITGYTPDEVIGRNPNMLSSGRHDQAFYREMWDRLQNQGYWRGEIWNRRKNGEIFPEWLSISIVRGDNGKISRYIALFSDISESRQAAERIHYLANYDALTGLANRTLLQNQMEQAIAGTQRDHAQLALLTVDLDRFKQINDSLGQACGDELLKRAAERLQALVPADGIVARHGGDEFHLLLSGMDMDGAAGMAQSVIEALSRPYSLDGHEVTVPPSIGIGLFPDDGGDVATLIGNAEAAMFHAKEQGGSRYQFFAPDMNASALQRMTLENSLRRALEHEEFLIHYQAQVDPKRNRIVGAEALLRWKHPEMDMVSPTVFIELAEESGVIVPLGEWMLRNVCRQIRAWQQAGERVVPISVNLSSRQFSQPNLPDMIEAILKESGVDPYFLELELTESTVMHDLDEAAQMIRRIKKLGIHVAVDDFGTGYSSLAYLKRFHIDKLKIDQSFIRELVDNADDSAIVRAIISMAHSLRLEVVAEGVETQKQLDFLKALNCDQIQGYFFSEALPPEAFAALLRAEKEKPE